MTSVIVPVYNGAGILPVTMPAVLALAGVDEWIWVDDGSTDATADVLAGLLGGNSRARVRSLASNQGRSAARNAGVEASRGDVLLFLDADVEPPTDAAPALAAAATAPGAVSGVARLDPVLTRPDDPYQDYVAHHPRGPSSDVSAGAHLDWRFFLSGACALRRDALMDAGGFREDVGYGEDVALGCTLATRHPDGLRLADATVRLHGLGDLDDAVRHAAAFGRSLHRVRDACRSGAVARLARLSALAIPMKLAASGLRAVIRHQQSGPMRRRLVRYLLASTIVSASRRA